MFWLNSALMILAGAGGAAATSLLHAKFGLSVVLASSLVGLLAAGVGTLVSDDIYLPAAAYAGSFVGMTAIDVAPLLLITIAGAGAGLLYAMMIAFQIFPGYGGRLGAIAFISTFLVIGAVEMLSKR